LSPPAESQPPPRAPAAPAHEGSALLQQLIAFGRELRAAGLPVTVGQLTNVVRALPWVDVSSRSQVFLTMRALLVTRREDLLLFERVFRAFWGVADDAGTSPQRMPRAPRHEPASPRFTIVNYMAFKASLAESELDVGDRSGTWTDVEQLRSKRFAEMTTEELDAVRRLLQEMHWRVALRTSRRRRPHRAGQTLDFRRILRHAGRLGAMPARLPRRRRLEKRRPVVLIADISGSMEKYSRLVLQFFHSAVRALMTVETFVFATRLSRITPQLRLRNIDRAMAEASAHVIDWAGGTRIGESLHAFNRDWSRRVLRRGAVVAIISDGCDRGDPALLRRELRWLQHRCHRLIWLNPHRLHPQYQPLVTGMAAALEFVDDFLPADNLDSLQDFARALAALPRTGRTRAFVNKL
jgi:uncharacterized protein with von Willebrand factor type A (vWA) domain